jgi:flagellar biogenesis protein FliO
MSSLIFLCLSIAVSVFLLKDSAKLDDLITYWQNFVMPSTEELALYASQVFYYLAMLAGLIYLVKKFRNKKSSSSE